MHENKYFIQEDIQIFYRDTIFCDLLCFSIASK